MPKTHGMAGTPTHTTWRKMRERCNNQKCDKWQWYGGKGIKVCDRWNESFEAFLADMGVRPEGTTLDRERSTGDYEPGNCRWATKAVQARNVLHIKMVEYRGESVRLLDLCDRLGVDSWRVRNRLRAGTPIEAAVLLPKGALFAREIGEPLSNAKLTADQVRYIRTCGKTIKVMTAEIGVSEGCVTKARRGSTHAHIAVSVL